MKVKYTCLIEMELDSSQITDVNRVINFDVERFQMANKALVTKKEITIFDEKLLKNPDFGQKMAILNDASDVTVDNIILRAYDIKCLISHGDARSILRLTMGIPNHRNVEEDSFAGSKTMWDTIDVEINKRNKANR